MSPLDTLSIARGSAANQHRTFTSPNVFCVIAPEVLHALIAMAERKSPEADVTDTIADRDVIAEAKGRLADTYYSSAYVNILRDTLRALIALAEQRGVVPRAEECKTALAWLDSIADKRYMPTFARDNARILRAMLAERGVVMPEVPTRGAISAMRASQCSDGSFSMYALYAALRAHLLAQQGEDGSLSHRVSPPAETPKGSRVASDGEDWMLLGKHINGLQQASMVRLVSRAKQSHFCDVRLRINGAFETYQADWIKWMEPLSAGGDPRGEATQPSPPLTDPLAICRAFIKTGENGIARDVLILARAYEGQRDNVLEEAATLFDGLAEKAEADDDQGYAASYRMSAVYIRALKGAVQRPRQEQK